MATLDDGQLRTVLAHEVMHPALLHPFRIGTRDLRTANIAADYVINDFLDQYNQSAVAKGEPAPFPWPKLPDGTPDVLIDHQYDGMSFEEVYGALANKPPGEGQKPPQQCQQQQSQQNQPGQGQPDANGQPQPGKGQNKPGKGQGTPDPNATPGQSEGEPSSPGEFIQGAADEAEAQAQEAKWKVALKQAATVAKSQGRLPGSMERLVNELLDPKASWREILRTLLTSAAKDDYTWTRPNPRYSGGGLILPSLHVPRMGKIAVAIDTSGSIGQKELDEFMAEVRSIMFDCRPEKLVIIQCDAEIHEYLELDPFDEIDVKLKGGGGTDFRPVFERLTAEPEPPAALVYLTDLMGSFPEDAPAYPVIWACNNERQAPFGETVNT
jgi:predicted metal-dependent peptidase